MTEDMLEEQAEILTQLGTSVEGARVRAQMQCASLLSDMEAFKVRNCGCVRGKVQVRGISINCRKTRTKINAAANQRKGKYDKEPMRS